MYLAQSGYIIPTEDILIDHYISQYDYDYPAALSKPLSVITTTGNKNGTIYAQIGIKGKKIPFSEVPPLNVCFCIDRSGSMTNMMPWVKNSFYIFIDQVRFGDTIALVDMNTVAQTLIPPTVIRSDEDRTKFKREVDKIQANGSTNVFAGMKHSYELLKNTQTENSINRVIILTDGMHNAGDMINKDILNLAAAQAKRNITISTIILGIQTSTGLMADVSDVGGGSSRFISNHDEMVKVFQTELDRMLVPAAREIAVTMELADGITLKETWGHQYAKEGSTIRYYLPTLHNGDYETIFAELAGTRRTGEEIARVTLEYKDLQNLAMKEGPIEIRSNAETVDATLIADPRVRQAEGLLFFSRGLIDISNKTKSINKLESELRQYANPSAQRADVVEQIKTEIRQIEYIIERLRDHLFAIETSLGSKKYEKEFTILDNYTETFNKAYTGFSSGETEQ